MFENDGVVSDGNCLTDNPLQFLSSRGERWKSGTGNISYISVNVLPEIIGITWGKTALAYVSGLRPSVIRVTEDEITTDAIQNRVTVTVDKTHVIQNVEMEVAVDLPTGIQNGQQLGATRRFLSKIAGKTCLKAGKAHVNCDAQPN